MTTTINASNASYKSRVNLVDFIMSNMVSQESGNTGLGVLVSGDPGIGKTSFAKFFSQFMGMTLITIEAPHITEEHVINIPFIVSNNRGDRRGDQEIDIEDYSLVLADSHLYGELTNARKIPDSELLINIYKSGADTQKIWEHLGGTQDKIPQEIVALRNRYSVILFLDEFFRQSSPRIRNMLRAILDGKIGTHDLPKNCYVLFASNMKNSSGTEGIEGMALNSDFLQYDFATPNKQDWFGWLVSKFKEDSKVQLDSRIVEKFHDLLDQEDLSHYDLDHDVRVSPRRWEQLLLLINAVLPLTGGNKEKDAKTLLTNVRANFKNYTTSGHAAIVEKVLTAVAELIQETSDVSISPKAMAAKSEWRDAMEQQIAVKMKLGDHRSYVPVISGQPGIGKTANALKIAEDLDLRYIYVNCSNFDQDDINGIPTANKKKDKSGGMEVKFSFPKLYRQIKEDMAKSDTEYKADLIKDGKEDEARKYDEREWKYLVFFDELNRTSTKVFNALRRVILEKNFGDDLKLPESTIVIAAINPTDMGTTPLTSHMKDVVDILDTAPSWKGTLGFMKDKIRFKNQIEPEMVNKITTVIKDFSDKFKNQTEDRPDDERNFYIDIGADTVYISPREYIAMLSTAVEFTNVKLNRLLPKFGKADTDEERTQLAADISEDTREAVFTAIKSILTNVESKHATDNPKFMHDLRAWIFSIDTLELLVKNIETMSFAQIMNHYYGKPDADLADEIEFTNYMNVVDLNDYTSDLRTFLLTQIADEDAVVASLVKKTYPHKKRIDGVITHQEDTVTKVEHFIREIIHAIKAMNMSNEFIAATRTALLKVLGQVPRDKSIRPTELMDFNKRLMNFLKEIQ